LAQLRPTFDNEINKPLISSTIKGYNYDIFICYRQKDIKHNGWVTEFVDNNANTLKHNLNQTEL